LSCLDAALATMDDSFRRATACLHCDLANVHLAAGDREAAAEHATLARSIAREVGSTRQLRRVAGLPLAA
jgi:hypothetical protein